MLTKKKLVGAVLTGLMAMQVAAVSQAATAEKKDAPAAVKVPKLALKIDRKDVAQLPRNFRRGDQAYFDKADQRMKDAKVPTRKGLDTVNYSASSCFSEKELEAVLANIPVPPSKFYDIDLRAESHGYVDGIAVSFFSSSNWGNDGREQFIVESIEKDQLKSAFKKQPMTLYTFNDSTNKVEAPIQYTASKVCTEAQLLKDHGANYFRLALQDHFRPDDSDVDRYLEFYKQLPADAWLHYHCFAGMGRTTVFAIMHDIIKNAPQGVSFDDIIKRQYLIGPTNLATWETKLNWKRKSYKERYIFTRQFYDYVMAHPKLDIPYSQWTKEHGYDSLDDDFSGYIWRIDNLNKDQMPRNFRTSQSPLAKEISKKTMKSKGVAKWMKDGHQISTKGLRELRQSGSSEFSYKEGEKLVAALKNLTTGPIYDMDLRQETHGYINGNAVSWYGWRDWGNYRKTEAQVLADEKARIGALKKGTKVLISELDKKKNPVDPQLVTVEEAITEEVLAKRLGMNYFRITATDHIMPTPENVDKFINFYKKLPKNAWLHYHCMAGEGRTTAYMVMQDMMENANDVPMYDILLRQNLIGGNFSAYTQTKMKKGEWKMDYYNHKAKYMKKFYKYCQEQAPKGFTMSWTDWLAKNDVL